MAEVEEKGYNKSEYVALAEFWVPRGIIGLYSFKIVLFINYASEVNKKIFDNAI